MVNPTFGELLTDIPRGVGISNCDADWRWALPPPPGADLAPAGTCTQGKCHSLLVLSMPVDALYCLDATDFKNPIQSSCIGQPVIGKQVQC